METKPLVEELLGSWNIGNVRAIEPIPSYSGKTLLVSVDKHCFILKEKSDLSQTEQEFQLLSCLSKVGTPVAVPIRTADGAGYTSSQGKIFCLYPKLPGKPVVEHYAGNARERARVFGQAIGFLHTCFLKCDSLSGFREMKLIEQIEEWAIPCIRKHRTIIDGDAVERIWAEVSQELEALNCDLPQQLIHRDANPANILFEQGALTGFVDFDMVVRGPRIFDICYCGSSILVSGFEDAARVEKWPGLFHSLLEGYQAVCPLTSPEYLALYGTLAAIQMLFAAFSLETQAKGAAKFNVKVLNWLSANRELWQLKWK